MGVLITDAIPLTIGIPLVIGIFNALDVQFQFRQQTSRLTTTANLSDGNRQPDTFMPRCETPATKLVSLMPEASSSLSEAQSFPLRIRVSLWMLCGAALGLPVDDLVAAIDQQLTDQQRTNLRPQRPGVTLSAPLTTPTRPVRR
jgi:hypothetical protein